MTAPVACFRACVPAIVLLLITSIRPALSSTPGLFEYRPGPIDRPLHLAAIDFNRDGWDDLLVANFQAGTVGLLLNRGGGLFLPHPDSPFAAGPAAFAFPTNGPLHFAIADFNPGDADGDGVPNATDNCPNTNNPAGTSGQDDDSGGAANGIGDACESLDASGGKIDSDGDGVYDYDPDALAGATDPIAAALDNCPLLPNPAQTDTDGDHVGDDCAASPDLAILGHSLGAGFTTGILRIRLNDGRGGLVGQPSKTTGVGPAEVLAADFDGAGLPDLLVSNSADDALLLWTGAGDGTFTLQPVITTGEGPAGLAAGDFNGDGWRDLAVANREAGTIGVYLNTGSGLAATALPTTASVTLCTPQPCMAPAPGSQPTQLLVGRLNDSDTLDDLVVLEQGGAGGGAIEIFTGTTSATAPLAFTSALSLGAGHRPRGGALADFDGNGDLDLVVGDFIAPGRMLVYPGLGTGTFGPPTVIAGPPEPAAVAILDYDTRSGGAGADPDLAVLSYSRNTIDLYRNDGTPDLARDAGASPVSPWIQSGALLALALDGAVGGDVMLLQPPPTPPAATGSPPPEPGPRVEALTGIGNGFLRGLRPTPIPGAFSATGVDQGDLRLDGDPDLLLIDSQGLSVRAAFPDNTGALTFGPAVCVETGAACDPVNLPVLGEEPLAVSIGPAIYDPDDFDRDGVDDVVDNCPTRFNPPGCTVTDAPCAVSIACTDAMRIDTDCGMLDPATGQCDSDGNGIGDHCQLLSATCLPQDSDRDGKPDFDPNLAPTIGGALGSPPDYDSDGTPNPLDNCPTVLNVNQADADGNGIGDACQTLDPVGGRIDTDGDGVWDYDPGAVAGSPDPVRDALDNCPTVPNRGQEDNDGDHVGNACLWRALDNCLWLLNSTQADLETARGPDDDCSDPFDNDPALYGPDLTCGTTDDLRSSDGVGDDCENRTVDVAVARPATNTVAVLAGDGSGDLRQAPLPAPLTMLARPVAVRAGRFTIEAKCASGCTEDVTGDLLVLTQGAAGNLTDDRLWLYRGLPGGSYGGPSSHNLQGDPTRLIAVPAQPVCENPDINGGGPDVRFDSSRRTTVAAVLEPSTQTVQIVLPGNQAGTPSLEPPPGNPVPLALGMTPADFVFTDLNVDGIQDLVILSAGDGDRSTPPAGANLVIYMGMGNGLFYTDATFNLTDLPDGFTRISSAGFNIQDDIYPDLVLYDEVDRAPAILTSTMLRRPDIDGSGRVDGYDLALLARAFGAGRGEDYLFAGDGSFLQSGSGVDRVLVSAGFSIDGRDEPRLASPGDMPVCDGIPQSVSPRYGLPVDLNLDGIVDGDDLALLASLFGRRL